MKTELLPNVTFPKIKIIAENGEQPVDIMLISITRPLEEAIKKSENLQIIRSITARGSCEISAFFNWDSDIDKARQQVESRISEIRNELPSDISIVIEKMNPSILAVSGFSLEGNKSPIELKMLAQYVVKPFLEQINGIREVAVIGGKNKEYQLVLDPEKMSQLGITPSMIKDILSQTNFIRSNGFVNDFRRLYLSLTDASVKSIDQIENLVIRSNEKGIVRIKDFAHVQVSEQREFVKIKANGKNVPLIAVMKQPEANLIEIDKQLQERIIELNTHLLPDKVKIRPYYNQADFVNGSIRSIRDVLWIGLLLAIVVAILFLRSYKSSLIILLSVPLSLSLTMVIMHAFGFNFNIMTLGAIAAAIGLVIDDAVVVVEQVHRTHEENPGENYSTIIPKAIRYLFPAMIGSSLSTIVIFIPFGIMTGIARSYFNIMTQTMIITLTCSFFVTWLFIPVLYIMFFSKVKEDKLKHSEVQKRNWVGFFINRPVIGISMILILILSTFIIFRILPSGFLPEMDEGSIVLDFISPPGTSLEETEKMLVKVDKILDSIPDITSYSRRTGTQMGFFITEPNTGDYLIQLKKKRDLSTEEYIDEIRQKIELKIPVLQVDFGQVVGDMLGDLMSSVQPVEVKLFGNNVEQIREYSRKIASEVEKVEGTADVFDGIVIAGPSINISPDIARLKQFNLSPDEFQLQLETQINGMVIGKVQDQLQFTDIRMIYPNLNNISAASIEKTHLFLPDGQLIPAKNLLSVNITSGVAEITRENLQNVGYIISRLNNRDLGSTLKDIIKVVSDKINLPPGMHIEYGGAYEQQQNAFRELTLILILAALLVFTVVLFLFRDIKIALLILFLTLLGPAGSGILLFILNIPLNVGSYIGIIMIVGIIGEASIFTYLQYEEERKKGTTVGDSIIYSISVRLRPKLMTALSAIVALLPLAIGIGTGAQMHQPLAIAVIGGLILALPVLLIILPTLLRLIENDE
jgi:heavy metal efflux system protein